MFSNALYPVVSSRIFLSHCDFRILINSFTASFSRDFLFIRKSYSSVFRGMKSSPYFSATYFSPTPTSAFPCFIADATAECVFASTQNPSISSVSFSTVVFLFFAISSSSWSIRSLVPEPLFLLMNLTFLSIMSSKHFML